MVIGIKSVFKDITIKTLNFLKGVFAKNERGYRRNAKNKRFRSLLILLLSVASIRRKLLRKFTENCVIVFIHYELRKNVACKSNIKKNLLKRASIGPLCQVNKFFFLSFKNL